MFSNESYQNPGYFNLVNNSLEETLVKINLIWQVVVSDCKPLTLYITVLFCRFSKGLRCQAWGSIIVSQNFTTIWLAVLVSFIPGGHIFNHDFLFYVCQKFQRPWHFLTGQPGSWWHPCILFVLDKCLYVFNLHAAFVFCRTQYVCYLVITLLFLIQITNN